MANAVEKFEAIVKATVGDKAAYHTFTYDDVMAVVTAARAAVQWVDGLLPRTAVNNYAPEPNPATDDVPPPNAPNTDSGEGQNDGAPQYIPS